MTMVRIKNSNGSENVLTWHKIPGGEMVNNDYYGVDGYYNAAKSFAVKTTMANILKELDAAKEYRFGGVCLLGA